MPACALFVIDIQVALARTAATEIPHAERIRDRATQILDKARSANDASEGGKAIAVVVVQHEESAESGDLQRGTAAWELVCPPRVDEQLVSKTVGDAFASNPDLASSLKAQGVETIVACGIQSECCVLATCKGALEAGFKVVLLRGAHSTYDAGDASAEVIEKEVEGGLEGLGVQVIDWDKWSV